MPTLESPTIEKPKSIKKSVKTPTLSREDRIRRAQATQPSKSMRTHWYFAYGSNLNISQMSARCTSSKPYQRLVLPGWQLVFRGVADIVPCEGARVVGALYQIKPRDEVALDIYEGYRAENEERGLYRKVYVEAQDTKTGNPHEIMFYVMNSSRIAPPSSYYLNTIRQGYEDWDLDTQTLEEAASASYQPVLSYQPKSYEPEPYVPDVAEDDDLFWGEF